LKVMVEGSRYDAQFTSELMEQDRIFKRVGWIRTADSVGYNDTTRYCTY